MYTSNHPMAGFQSGMGEFASQEAFAQARLTFIQRTYVHVAGALTAFALLLALLVKAVPGETMVKFFVTVPGGWLVVLLAFIAGTFLARRLAAPDMSKAIQYAGLGIYVVLEALIFWPIMWYLDKQGEHAMILQAALMTLALAGGLTIGVFTTRKDFSFLGPIVGTGCLVALALIVCAILFGLNLGTWFALGMIALMCACILYETSQIMLHWDTEGYVAAALELFASIVTLFWYILRLYMSSRD
jgi:FtsH-binding integral membrane protein